MSPRFVNFVALFATLIVILGHGNTQKAQHEPPIVWTQFGILRGAWSTSSQGTRYAAFTRVPYALPPVGDRRFEVPVPIVPWHGELEAWHITPPCLQFAHLLGTEDKQQIKGQEDCLYLNIYTPKLPTSTVDEKLNVLVFIHGGAFMFSGSADYGPKILMDRNIILVTINYRLGPLGFLSLGDSVQPGNNGLRDQVLALRWIKENIADFNGNPESITLIGCSAGGASVHYHYLSPLSQGLFNRGISMSGTALSRWALTDNLREKSLQLAATVGCPTDQGSKVIIECLKHRPAEKFLEYVDHFQVWQYSPYTPFGPVVESKTQLDPKPFLPDTPLQLLHHGTFSRVPWVTGVTTAEGLYPAAAFVASAAELEYLDTNFNQLLPHLLDFNHTTNSEEMDDISSAIRMEYFGNKPVNDDTVPQLIKMVGDRLFVVDNQRAAELQAKYAPVYFYEFDYRGKHSLSEIMSGTDRDFGVSHADDTSYFLNVSYIEDDPRSGIEHKVEALILDLWTSYASTGVPTSSAIDWRPVQDKKKLSFLHIHGKPLRLAEMTSVEDLGNAVFWESLPFHGEHTQSYAHLDRSEHLADEL